MLWQRAIVAYGVGSDKAQFGVINQFPAQKLDDPSLLWVWQTDFVLQDDKGIIQLLRKDSLLRDVRDELKYGSDFALTASNPQNATETKVLEKDAYKQEGGEFNLPEFSSKEGDSTEWASDGAGAKGLLRIPVYLRELDLRRYELKDHLGNVRVTVSDTKLPNLTPTGDPAFFEAELESYSNYYAFGMEMPGRVYDKGGYRYGFNGMEGDNEVNGSNVIYMTEYREYESRLGRWFSIDPKKEKYSDLSPYSFSNNSPLIFVDYAGDTLKLAPGLTTEQKLHIVGNLQKLTDDKLAFKTLKDGSVRVLVANVGKGKHIAGTNLIRQLNENKHTVTIIPDANLTYEGSKVEGDQNAGNGIGCNSVVYISPGARVFWVKNEQTEESYFKRGTEYITLGHELIHALRTLNGKSRGTGSLTEHAYIDYNGQARVEKYPIEELIATGFFKSLPNDISENALRKEQGLEIRASYDTWDSMVSPKDMGTTKWKEK